MLNEALKEFLGRVHPTDLRSDLLDFKGHPYWEKIFLDWTPDTITLDGSFNAQELRQIADWLDAK